MQEKDIKELIIKYQSGKSSKEEAALIESWYLKWENSGIDLSGPELQKAVDRIEARLPKADQRSSSFFWPKMVAAAVFIFILSIGFYFYGPFGNSTSLDSEQKQWQTSQIVPGGEKAVLILADGSSISLNDASDGDLIEQAGVKITKSKDGQLVYTAVEAASSSNNSISSYNTISTPKGGQYQIVLPDGTKVWLNAASSLKYPTRFTGAERKVELNGEAYFEVSEQLAEQRTRKKSFIVKTDHQEVEVLGTHFNISSYPEEMVTKTTLIEGSIRVSNLSNGDSKLLVSNQQSVMKEGDAKIQVSAINPESILAWKNGYFFFAEEDIYSIMKKLARWYDVEVEYRGQMPKDGFGGIVSRSDEISELLNMLEHTGRIHFKVEGRRIIVMP